MKRLREIIVAEQPCVRAANRTPLAPDRQWQLEVWGDGYAWLSIYGPDHREPSMVTFEEPKLEVLTRELEAWR